MSSKKKRGNRKEKPLVDGKANSGKGEGDMSAGYSGRVWTCPFFRWDERERLHCEGGCIAFQDRETFAEYAENFCCSVENWESCTLAGALVRQYDRQEEQEEEQNEEEA